MPHSSAALSAGTAAASARSSCTELDTRCPVPGSYGLDFIATAKMQSGAPERRFLMFRTRRYDPEKLAGSLTAVGWHLDLVIPYGHGDDGKPTMALMLFRKQ